MKTLFDKYKHAWVFVYVLIYLPWFFYLEKQVTYDYNLVQTDLDYKIPLLEIFIIPYLLWFLFVACTVVYFFFKDRQEFYRLAIFLAFGMTLFLIICTIWPNGHTLRPQYYERDNILVDLVKRLHTTDTPTNVFPSIHVYNSLACYAAVRNSKHLKNKKWIQVITFALTASITLSTMFLKQHSFIDVIGAGVFALIAYYFVYANEARMVQMQPE